MIVYGLGAIALPDFEPPYSEYDEALLRPVHPGLERSPIAGQNECRPIVGMLILAVGRQHF